MSIHSLDQYAFKRAAQALSKLPGASSLNACQTALAQASGHRDLHHLQALQSKMHHPAEVSVVSQADIVARLHRTSGLRIGDILDALTRTRFFGGNPDPEATLTVREALFAADYPDRGRHDVGAPCRVKAPGYDNTRALLVERGEGPEGLTRVMIDHDIMTCVSREAPAHRAGRLFVPLRFWMPYGVWTEADGAKVLFSRDYCPLWRSRRGGRPCETIRIATSGSSSRSGISMKARSGDQSTWLCREASTFCESTGWSRCPGWWSGSPSVLRQEDGFPT